MLNFTKKDILQLAVIAIFVISNLIVANFLSIQQTEAEERFVVGLIDTTDDVIRDHGSYQKNFYYTTEAGSSGEITTLFKFDINREKAWEVKFTEQYSDYKVIIAIGSDYIGVKSTSALRLEINPTTIDNETLTSTIENEILLIRTVSGSIYKTIQIPHTMTINHSLSFQLLRVSYANGIIHNNHLFIPALIRESGANNTRFRTDLMVFDYNLGTDEIFSYKLLPDGDEREFTRWHRSQSFHFNQSIQNVLRLSFIVGIVNQSFTNVDDKALHIYDINYEDQIINYVPQKSQEFLPCGSDCHYGLTDEGRLSKLDIYNSPQGLSANVSLFDVQREWNFRVVQDFPTLENIVSFENILALRLRDRNGVYILYDNGQIFTVDLGVNGVSSSSEILALYKAGINKLGILNHDSRAARYSLQIIEFRSPQEINEKIGWFVHGLVSTIIITPVIFYRRKLLS